MRSLTELVTEYKNLGIQNQIDYEKLYLYSVITHSTAVEGSTVTEIENRLLFDEGISPDKPIEEQLMNLDLKKAYDEGLRLAGLHESYSVEMLCSLSALVMKNTGADYSTLSGHFSSAKGELRRLNVSAGRGGRSYMAWQKVPARISEFCEWLNGERRAIDVDDILKVYELSFKAHYHLVYIHPWADGNGRMARLVMNMIQYEFGMIPSIVLRNRRADYIKSLSESQETGDLTPFLNFMTGHHAKNLEKRIHEYKESIEDDTINFENDTINDTIKLPQKEQVVLDLIRTNPDITIAMIVERTGFSRATATRAIRSLREKKLLTRIGSNKNGHWQVLM